jgi:hypothetical protein
MAAMLARIAFTGDDGADDLHPVTPVRVAIK